MTNQIYTNKELRNFGLLFGILFPIIIGLLIPLLYKHDFRFWTFIISFPILIIALTSPKLLKYPHLMWLRFGDFLGFVNSHIILGLIFLIVLLPISLLMKLFRYDPLASNKSQNNSYKKLRLDKRIDLTRIF